MEFKIVRGKLEREEILEIPEDALREAIINAVTHRDYFHIGISVSVEIFSDRVEIYNFGGLPKGLNKKDFGTKSVLRNKLIADLMQRLGYIEKFGTGIKSIKKLVKEAGLEEPKFKLNEFFTIIFPRKPLYFENGNDAAGDPGSIEEKFGDVFGVKFGDMFGVKSQRFHRLLKTLDFIEKNRFSVKSFAEIYELTPRAIENDIDFLKGHKLIVFEGSPKTGKYKVTDKYKKLKKQLKR